MGSRAEPTQSWGGSWGWELLSTACWGCRGSSSPGIQGPLRQSPHGAPNTTMHCTRLKAKGNRAFSFLFFFFPLLVRAPLSIWPFQFDDGKYFAVTNKQLQPPVLTHRSAAPAMRIPVLLSVQPALHTAQHPATQQHIPANIHMHTLQQRKKRLSVSFPAHLPGQNPSKETHVKPGCGSQLPMAPTAPSLHPGAGGVTQRSGSRAFVSHTLTPTTKNQSTAKGKLFPLASIEK